MLLLYFRVSLVATTEPDSFGAIDRAGVPYDRESWIREYFSEEREFAHRGTDFLFRPVPPSEHNLRGDLLYGWIAKAITVAERTPPSAGFDPIERPSWRGAFMIIDPTEHADGQKIALERRKDIGRPASIMASLARQMQIGHDPSPFDAQIYTIAAPRSFWSFAESEHFKIRSLSFEVATPNMFDGKDAFSSELRTLRNRNKVQRLNTSMYSENDIKVDEENIREIVAYTEQGAGDIKARAASGARYNSRDHASKDQVDTESDREDFWDKIKGWLEERF